MKLRHILFVDTEATCWENQPEYQKEHREIIEIGIVKVDNIEKKVVDSDSYLIKPINSKISEYCTNLTGITPELLSVHGTSLSQARKQILRKYGKNTPWFSWGAFDRHFIQDQCEKQNLEYFLSEEHYNLSALYSMMNGLSKRVGLGKAMNRYGVVCEKRHRAVYDAMATAEVYMKMFRG